MTRRRKGRSRGRGLAGTREKHADEASSSFHVASYLFQEAMAESTCRGRTQRLVLAAQRVGEARAHLDEGTVRWNSEAVRGLSLLERRIEQAAMWCAKG